MAVNHLNELQLDLLKLYSTDMNESDLLGLKQQLARYFAEKGIKEADRIWNEKGYTSDTMKKWLNGDE